MGTFANLSDSDLEKALTQTSESIDRGYAFLRSLDGRQSLGLMSMAESTIRQLELLEAEKRELEAEHSRRQT